MTLNEVQHPAVVAGTGHVGNVRWYVFRNRCELSTAFFLHQIRKHRGATAAPQRSFTLTTKAPWQ
jgi:hypothetical protein